MFATQNLSVVPPYDYSLALHSHGDRDQSGMESVLGVAEGTHAEPTGVKNGGKYLQALCWLLLVDFAAFEYDLPPACQHGVMQDALALSRKIVSQTS